MSYPFEHIFLTELVESRYHFLPSQGVGAGVTSGSVGSGVDGKGVGSGVSIGSVGSGVDGKGVGRGVSSVGSGVDGKGVGTGVSISSTGCRVGFLVGFPGGVKMG